METKPESKMETKIETKIEDKIEIKTKSKKSKKPKKEYVFSRKLNCKVLTFAVCGPKSDNADFIIAEEIPYFSKIEDMNGKVLVSFTDPDIFGSLVFENVWLKLRSEFVKEITSIKPTYFHDENRSYHNCAWVMGKLYSFDSYQYSGTITNDIYIGAVVINLIPNKRRSYKHWFEDEKLSGISHINESDMKTIHPSLLWISENEGHGVGAFVFYHEDSQGEIDSVMIDNCYFEQPADIPKKAFILHDDGNFLIQNFESKPKNKKNKKN